MDIKRLTVHTFTIADIPTLRINAYLSPSDGVYVLVPLTEIVQADKAQLPALIAVTLEEALRSLVYIWEHPEEAAEDGTLSDPEDVSWIRRFRETLP